MLGFVADALGEAQRGVEAVGEDELVALEEQLAITRADPRITTGVIRRRATVCVRSGIAPYYVCSLLLKALLSGPGLVARMAFVGSTGGGVANQT